MLQRIFRAQRGVFAGCLAAKRRLADTHTYVSYVVSLLSIFEKFYLIFATKIFFPWITILQGKYLFGVFANYW